MSHVYVNATLKGKHSKKVRFMVDTGATYSFVSPELAKGVGLVESASPKKVRLANGKVVKVRVAMGLLCVAGREAHTLFWIGPCDEPLLGVETIEALGLAVDPSRGRLKPTRPYSLRLGGFGRP